MDNKVMMIFAYMWVRHCGDDFDYNCCSGQAADDLLTFLLLTFELLNFKLLGDAVVQGEQDSH